MKTKAPKITKKLLAECDKFNQLYRRSNGMKKLTIEQYVNYVYGKGLPESNVVNTKKQLVYTVDIPSWSPNNKVIPSCKNDHVPVKKNDGYKKEISKNYPVAVAYNKGGYQCLLPSEIKNAGQKV